MATQPNILQIVVDDMGYGDLGCFNFGTSRTPNLDALIGEGVWLSQHYSASAVCAPARAGLLTGRYPHRTGAIDTLEGRGLDRLGLRERTLADMLAAAVYATGLVGKWHNGALDDRYHPNRRGFAEFVGFRGGWRDYWDWRLERNGSTVPADGRYLTDVLTEEAIAFIRRHRSGTFYLHLAYNAPHTPLQAPEAVVRPFVERGAFSRAVATIFAMVQVVDDGVGRILSELEELGIADNTLVLFTSDNGPQFGGEGDADTRRFNCGFNGAKGRVYEGGIRVPAVLRWPDGLDGGRTVHEMAHFIDWLPTLLAAADVPQPREGLPLDGVSVLPTLRGEQTPNSPTRFWQWNRYEPLDMCNAAMRDGDWKLVYPAIGEAMRVAEPDLVMDRELKYHPERHPTARLGPYPERHRPTTAPIPLLFNLAADPLEQHDLAEVEPTRTAKMSNELATWFEDVEKDRNSIDD